MLGVIILLFVLSISTILAGTQTPIIGILSQETYSVDKYFPNQTFKSYIAASYVKHLESAGARVVPIWIGRDESYYREIVEKLNGVFWPGGATYFNETGGYGDAGRHLYQIILEKNRNGIYFPLWTTCLGMELLAEIILTEDRIDCSAVKIALPLDLKQDFKDSRLFRNASDEVIEILKTQNVTYNYHRYCITESMFIESNLLGEWKILATNKDLNGLEFVSAFESKLYPFYGIQFHPEKNQFEFKLGQNIPHWREAILTSQYFADFFVEDCRKNNNTFGDWNKEQKALIYNYIPYFTGIQNSAYEQLYMFDEKQNLN